MKSTFKGLVVGICGVVGSACFFLGVFALLVWAVYTGGLSQWLREVFSILWFVAALASILAAAIALSIQRDRRTEKSLDAKFEEEVGEMYEPMDKDPAWQLIRTGARLS
jgi:hypothetical protein